MHLEGHPWLGKLYGGIRHSAKQIFTGELGWFDGDPTTLGPIHSIESSKRYVDLIGGTENVMAAAQVVAKAGDYQWAAELATHAIRVDLTEMEPRNFKADILPELAYLETNINLRNWYLTSAEDLESKINRSLKSDLNAPDILGTYTEAQLVAAMRFNLNAEKTAEDHYTVAFQFGKKLHAMEIRRSIAEFHEYYSGTSEATVGLTKGLFLGTISGQVDFDNAVENGVIEISEVRLRFPSSLLFLKRRRTNRF